MNRQDQIIEFVKLHISQKGYPPTVREIAAAVGLKSSSTASGHLDKLKKKGLIHWEPYEVRTLRILNPTSHDDPPIVLELKEGCPYTIEWQGRRYRYDPG